MCGEVAGVETAAIAGAAELGAGVPVRRRLGAALLPSPADFVVGGALLGILQHFPGLGDVLEARLGVGLLRDVGVVLARQLAVGALDLVGRRVARSTLSRVGAQPLAREPPGRLSPASAPGRAPESDQR